MTRKLVIGTSCLAVALALLALYPGRSRSTDTVAMQTADAVRVERPPEPRREERTAEVAVPQIGARDAAAPEAGRSVREEAATGAVEKALRRLTSAELSLYREFERARTKAPPETDELLARFRAGAERAQLESFVRTRFPRDAKIRLAAATWIGKVKGTGSRVSDKPAKLERPASIRQVR